MQARLLPVTPQEIHHDFAFKHLCYSCLNLFGLGTYQVKRLGPSFLRFFGQVLKKKRKKKKKVFLGQIKQSASLTNFEGISLHQQFSKYGPLIPGVPKILSGLQSQNYPHNNTKMLFMFLILFNLSGCWLRP